MRSSKKRSRSSQNRPRTLGNIINRVFDSSGPEGKVRGTPQQIIEKYQMLARDAQLSNDRVAAENFLQHAEHYTRLLAEAQREQAAEQEARQQQFNQGGGNGNGGNNGNRDYRDRADYRDRERSDFRDPGAQEQPSVDAMEPAGGDSGLVETPEARRRDQRPQGDRPQGERQQGDRPQGERPQGERPQGERRDRRDRDFRRDRDDRRRGAEAEAQPDLPAFITGGATAEAPASAPVTPAPETPAMPEAAPDVPAAAEAAPKPAKARRPRKPAAAAEPAADSAGDAPEAAE
jgi:hypothetical protein